MTMATEEVDALRLENLNLKLELLKMQFEILKKERDALDVEIKARKQGEAS